MGCFGKDGAYGMGIGKGNLDFSYQLTRLWGVEG